MNVERIRSDEKVNSLKGADRTKDQGKFMTAHCSN